MPNIKSQEEGGTYVGLGKLKDDLLEIEVYEKEQLTSFIKGFREEVRKINDIMQGKTNTLREKLDNKKTGLKEKIEQILSEFRAKIEALDVEKLEEVKEGEEEAPKDEKMDKIFETLRQSEFN